MKLYGEISKTEELDDGTIKVWGYASSEAVDSDGEIITAEAMKAAMGDYMKFGAVREMHQAKAAGTAIEMEVQDDGRTWFGAHVVDSEAVKKVKASVYKGFSIGGKVTERDDLNKSVIKGLKLIEVSLVDRPANPEAVFTCYKAETVEEVSAVDALAELLNKGEITPERLLELAKNDGTPGDSAVGGQGEAATGEEITKGMWNVQDFACALQDLAYICMSAEWDKQSEGDNSPIPAQLREWIAQGVEIFKAMAAEELSEMLAQLQEQAGEVDVIEMAAKFGRPLDVTKAGAKFSKATKEALAKCHGAMKEACDHLDKLGYDADKDDDDGADKGAKGEDLAKVSGELDLAKAEITKLSDELTKAQARVKQLEAEPAPGKALLKALVVGKDEEHLILKTADSDAKKVEPVKNPDGSENEAATLIKAIHADKL